MPDSPSTPTTSQADRLRAEEYAALRATIRERGTRRVTLVVSSLIAWAAMTLVVLSWASTPVSTMVPLIVLAAGFESAFALHVGVERIGRYLQVVYESSPEGPRWEHTAMHFGTVPTPASGRIDPLFSSLFILATAVNAIPLVLFTVGLPGAVVELAAFGVLHLGLIARILLARAYALRQRDLDLAALTKH